MINIYLFFAAFQLLATIVCMVFCFKISRLNMTPTLTFLLLAAAFCMRIMSQVHGFFYVTEMVNFYNTFSTKLIIGSNTFGAITMGLFLIAFLRIYQGLKDKGIK